VNGPVMKSEKTKPKKAAKSPAPDNPKDIFDPNSNHRRPFARIDGTIEWPRGWSKKDAKAWRDGNGY